VSNSLFSPTSSTRVTLYDVCARLWGPAGLQTLAEAVAPPCAAALGCSVAAVQQAGPLELLVSTGNGALVLLSGADSGAAPAVSAAVQPLPQAQPFVLEAAYRASAGAFCIKNAPIWPHTCASYRLLKLRPPRWRHTLHTVERAAARGAAAGALRGARGDAARPCRARRDAGGDLRSPVRF